MDCTVKTPDAWSKQQCIKQCSGVDVGLQDFVLQQLKGMQGVKVLDPEGAFYVLPDCSALCGPQAHAPGFGGIPDDDALCRQAIEACMLEHAHAAGLHLAVVTDVVSLASLNLLHCL